MTEVMQLNKYQIDAVENDDRACLVNASVGSGKTSVLIAKIKRIINNKLASLDKIVILTFTNKAATEIRNRLKEEIGDLIDELKYCGTFHSVALAMIENEFDIKELGFANSPQVIEQNEQVEIAESIILEKKYNIKYKNKIAKRIELARDGKHMYANMKNSDDIVKIIQDITAEKIKQNKISFDDIIDDIVKLTASKTFIADYVIVDEFQDCDSQQLLFINNIVNENSKLFAVGDPSQIIYSWRGSKSNVFDQFINTYNATQLSLPLNYRSTQVILEVAKSVLKNNDKLVGVKDFGQKINIKEHYNQFYESEYLANKIKQLASDGYKYSDISILYRLQKQSIQIEKMFDKYNIPYEVSLKKKISDIPVLKWFLKLLKCCINVEDVISMHYVLLDTDYGVFESKKTMKNKLLEKENCDTKLICDIMNFKKWINENNDFSEVYAFFDLNKLLKLNSATLNEDKNYVCLIIEKINSYISDSELSTFESLKAFVNSVALYGIDVLFDKENSETDCVKLTTMHAAKGLEFKCVFIIGANFGSIPMRGKTAEDDEEEKRLFFVAITRAKEVLEISYYTSPSDSRMVGGRSHYLSYIPRQLISGKSVSNKSGNIKEMIKEIKANVDVGKKAKRCRHIKYGEGDIISQNDDLTVVNFDNYGEKTFVTMFYEVEEI